MTHIAFEHALRHDQASMVRTVVECLDRVGATADERRQVLRSPATEERIRIRRFVLHRNATCVQAQSE